ncbi:MAG: hypothetical protein ACOYL1_00060 [Chlamydiia bacterium]|jgi:chromosome segregation ATPase
MHKIGAFFSPSNRSVQPDPVLELATLNRELQRQNRELSATNNLQADSIKKLKDTIQKNKAFVQSQKAQLKVLETTNSELANQNDALKMRNLESENEVFRLFDETVPRAAAVSEVLGYLVDSAVDIAERKTKDEHLKTKVQTLEADLTRIKNQRNVLVVTLTALVAGSVLFCLKK